MEDMPTSYGPAFNYNGGGWYVVERGTDEINVWFYPRYGDVPEQVRWPAGSVNTAELGEPQASFPDTHCDINKKFGPQTLVINLTFCGDWAGSPDVYSQSGCPSTCEGKFQMNISSPPLIYHNHRLCQSKSTGVL